MNGRLPLWTALTGNCLIAAAIFIIDGWNKEAAHAAARDTARFSLLWFTVAFAAPGIRRLFPVWPAEAKLIRAFVAGHLVHFSVVLALIVSFETAHLRQKPVQVAAIVIVGFVVVITAGITATPRASALYTAVRTLAIYAAFLIFFLAYVRHPVRPMRLLAVPLALALIIRLGSNVSVWTARAKTAKLR